jgi:hypothetical protein
MDKHGPYKGHNALLSEVCGIVRENGLLRDPVLFSWGEQMCKKWTEATISISHR